MTHDITIPPEAVEAAKREAAATVYRIVEPDTRAHELTENEVAQIVTAALRAGIKAWPGRTRDYMRVEDNILLPLPQDEDRT